MNIKKNSKNFNIESLILEPSHLEPTVKETHKSTNLSKFFHENAEKKHDLKNFGNKNRHFFSRCEKKKSKISVSKTTDIQANELQRNKTTKISQKFTDFILFLMLVLRAIRNLKWRSSLKRTLEFVGEKEILFINDASHFQEEEQNISSDYSFIRNKYIRLKLLSLRKKCKQCLFAFGI